MTDEATPPSGGSRRSLVLVLVGLLVGVAIGVVGAVLIGSDGGDGSSSEEAVLGTSSTTAVGVDGTNVDATTTSVTTSSTSVPGGAPAPVTGEQYVVPELVGRTVAVAEDLLTRRSLRSLYVVVSEWRVAKDIVTTQDQAPGTVLGPGGVVSFRVSSGPVVTAVPGVVGQCVAAAQERLVQAGFPSQVFYRVDAAKYHRVISMSPIAAAQQMQGSMVTLYVSTNPAADGCS